MVCTRSQFKNDVEEVAAATPLRDTREILNLAELITFVEVARVKPEHGAAVDYLSIILKVPSLERDIVQKYLPVCLALTPNLTILEIFTTPPILLPSLSSVPLPRVDVLKTNLPHRTLYPFLATHPTLRALDISSCGRTRQCPLSPAVVGEITDVRCPLGCAPRLAHERLEHLRVDLPGPTTLASAVLAYFPVPLDALYVLTVEFSVDDAKILDTIAASMPAVRHLKLVEKTKPLTHKHKPRPWFNRTAWSASLNKMVDLERLLIYTAGSVGTTPGNAVLERSIFHNWVNPAAGPSHPTLHYIGVWQRATSRDGGLLSEWSRVDGSWGGTWTPAPDPDRVALFL
ncbi:hypothetical protein C8Q76DRAFT_789321 [Earliella scabrosa]|nr:hypothetical protein C8Q76DRAFT_802175 [Earliella scabrosa]KAI0744846.1 hypothetical protein C8Q76DRAFT_789321 [Earliella scabrosa]